jgi:hypothetical protein
MCSIMSESPPLVLNTKFIPRSEKKNGVVFPLACLEAVRSKHPSRFYLQIQEK